MNLDNKSLVCGIDLGTTNSCIAVLKQGKTKIISIDNNQTMPSVVACREGEWLVGEAARNHLWVAPGQAVASIKRKMDDPHYRVNIADQSLSPIDISAKILQKLVACVEQQLQRTVNGVIITVPAWFKETQRQATLAAGKQAGLNIIQIINEPTAAAIAHQNIPIAEGKEEKWVVYDLGGGTFDVSVMNVTSASYEVLASLGNTFLGGDDFDHRLTDKLISCLRDQHNVDAEADEIAKTRLQLLAEKTKIRLSTETHLHIEEPIVIGSQSYLLDISLSREDFEELIDDLVNSTLEKAAQALAESSIAHSNISRLLLVGGSSRIPMIAERLEQRFNITPENWLDPDLSVAMGASIQAAIASDQYFERSVVDICPHTLGIATLGDEDQLGLDGLPTDIEHQHPLTFAPLIRRNSRLPADFVRTFYKLSEFQEGVVIPVYQGEHSNTRQNDFIGEFNVELHNRASNELDIRFCYDINGTIKISVAERGNSQPTVYSMDLSRSVEQNSDSEFSGQLTAINGASVAEPELAVSNYLVEKVSSRLSQLSESAPTEIATLLEQYKKLLELDDEEGIDEIEDTLYEWLEAE